MHLQKILHFLPLRKRKFEKEAFVPSGVITEVINVTSELLFCETFRRVVWYNDTNNSEEVGASTSYPEDSGARFLLGAFLLHYVALLLRNKLAS
jgi:hypothetical protein